MVEHLPSIYTEYWVPSQHYYRKVKLLFAHMVTDGVSMWPCDPVCFV